MTVFNSNADSQDIVSLVGDMTGISTTNELKQITRACNEANKKVWAWIFDSYGGWQYDDSNNANLPVATANIVANQQKYTLPSEALTVQAVEYMNAGNSWMKLDSLPIALLNQHTSEKEWGDDAGEPRYYSLLNGLLKLYPASNESRTSALRIQFDRGSTTFASTDTTKTPGFASEFHEAVAVGGSYYIARNKKLPQVAELKDSWMDYEMRIKDYYKRRWQEEFPPKMRVNDLVTEYM